jgi:hypothetical protein
LTIPSDPGRASAGGAAAASYDDAAMATPDLTPPRRGRRRSRARRRRWPWVVGILVVLGVWGAFTAVARNRARVHTPAGVDQLEAARDVLSPRGLVRGEGIDLLRSARTEFAAARTQVRSPLLAPLRVLPVVGRQVRSVDALTGAARDVVDAGVNAIEGARTQLRQVKPVGHERVVLVQRLGEVASVAYEHLAAVDLGPSKALIGPLADARTRFGKELRKLKDATARSRDASAGMARFLQGPSTYLVFAANNNEMRIGSGTFLSVGTLTVNDGAFDLGDLRPTAEFQVPAAQAPKLTGDFAKRWGWLQPNQEFRNLASSPIFPTQAAVATRMWTALGNPKVDGVLALDPVALKALVQATHPVVVDGKQYGPNNLLPEVYLNQYVGLSGTDEVQQARRDRLSAIAKAAIQNLQGDFDTTDLIDTLRIAAEGRHIIGWSRDRAEQAGWEAAGIGGILGRDSLMLGVHNRGGNKLDQFLDVQAHLRTATDAKGTAVSIAVTMTNNSPAGLPQYVAGPYPNAVDSKEGRYQGLLTAELPSLARDIYITDAAGKRLKLVASGSDEEQWVASAYVQADRAQTAKATVHFRLPAGDRRLSVEPSARVPAIDWRYEGRRWRDEGIRDLTW